MDLYDFFLGEFSYVPLMFFLVVILTVIGKFTGKFPPPLPRSEFPKRILTEVGSMCLILTLYLTLYIFVLSPIFIAHIGDSYFIGLGLGTILYLIPLIYVRYRDHWTSKDLGITSEVKSWVVVIVSISFYILFGIYNFFRREPTEIYWYYLFLLFYSNAFLEEFLFRGIIQTKLEQALGQRKAILYQAFLFMLIHIPGNIMQFSMDGNISRFYWNFGFQFVHGIVFGLIFLKTRNIWTSVICHFLNNWMGTLIILLL